MCGTVAWLWKHRDDEQFDLAAWFLSYINIELVTCGQLLLYLLIFRQSELCRVFYPCCCDKINLGHNLATYLHLIVRMNDELRLAVSIDETLTIVIEIHMKTVLRKYNQVGIGNHQSFGIL